MAFSRGLVIARLRTEESKNNPGWDSPLRCRSQCNLNLSVATDLLAFRLACRPRACFRSHYGRNGNMQHEKTLPRKSWRWWPARGHFCSACARGNHDRHKFGQTHIRQGQNELRGQWQGHTRVCSDLDVVVLMALTRGSRRDGKISEPT
jgi:hypothetical protein